MNLKDALEYKPVLNFETTTYTLVHPEESPMTVKELHTFTDAEIETITDALRIANGEYRKLAELVKGTMRQDFRVEFEEQARAASDLQLKIEAAK